MKQQNFPQTTTEQVLRTLRKELKAGLKFNLTGPEGCGVKIIRRIKKNYFEIKMLPVGKFYKNAPSGDKFERRIGFDYGKWIIKL